MENNTGTRAQNFGKLIEQVVIGYETDPAKGLVHGFQKDAIQNSWGHRVNTKGINWNFTLHYKENKHGNFLIVEDNGATGLIGKNYTIEELNNIMDSGESFSPDEKLARFSSLFNSGGNTTSAGLFGRGKLMYQAISKTYKYYFDSYTAEGNYVANYIEKDKMLFKSLEGSEAKLYIKNNTGLEEKEITGTRIIICDPKQEIIDSIKNGDLIKGINETWWRIFEKFNASVELKYNDELISVGKVPDLYSKYYSNKIFSKTWDNINVKPGYRIKNMGMFYTEENEPFDEDLYNVSFYRNNMKIGDIFSLEELNVDDKLKNRICGYIEFDSEWEKELEKNERLEHYGVQNKRENNFQFIKKALSEKLEEFLILKELKKKEKRNDPNTKLKELANNLTDFLKDCNVDMNWDSLNTIKANKPLIVDIVKFYPNDGNRIIENNQSMSFKYKIKKNVIDSEFNVSIIAVSKKLEEKELFTEIINIENANYQSQNITIYPNQLYEKQRNLIKILVKSTSNSETKCIATFPVFVECDEIFEDEDITFKIRSFDLPNTDNRTVRYNEKIENISLTVKNNLNYNFIGSIGGYTQDVRDRNNTIDNFYRSNNLEIESGKTIEISLADIIFGEKYLNRKGPIKVKFKLSHIEGLNYDKGQLLKEFAITILYEEDHEDISSVPFKINMIEDDDVYKKSELKSVNGIYELGFNQKYCLYSQISDNSDDITYKLYFLEEMIKSIIQIKFETGDYSIINSDEKHIVDIDTYELIKKVNQVTNRFLAQFIEQRG